MRARGGKGGRAGVGTGGGGMGGYGRDESKQIENFNKETKKHHS